MRELGTRQRRFVDEYLVHCNATRAAIVAGYSKNTASQAGWEVLRNPKVAAEITRRQRRLSDRHEVAAENVISELAKIGFSNAADFYTVDGDGRVVVDKTALRDRTKAAAIAQVEVSNTKDGQVVRLKLFDKRAALSDLSRHLGVGRSRLEIGVDVVAGAQAEPSVREMALAALALLREQTSNPSPPDGVAFAKTETGVFKIAKPEVSIDGDEIDSDF